MGLRGNRKKSWNDFLSDNCIALVNSCRIHRMYLYAWISSSFDMLLDDLPDHTDHFCLDGSGHRCKGLLDVLKKGSEVKRVHKASFLFALMPELVSPAAFAQFSYECRQYSVPVAKFDDLSMNLDVEAVHASR